MQQLLVIVAFFFSIIWEFDSFLFVYQKLALGGNLVTAQGGGVGEVGIHAPSPTFFYHKKHRS